MKHYWINSKEKLVSVEEGKVAVNLESVPKNGSCKKFMQLVQFILLVEIALFLGWACYSIYQSKYISSVNIQEDHLKLNSVSALRNDLKLNPESPNESNVIAWKEKSSQHESFEPPSSSEPWSAKTPIDENPDSSTERDPDLVNKKDSVYHPGSSSSSDVTTPTKTKTSTYENYRETTENAEEAVIWNMFRTDEENLKEVDQKIEITTVSEIDDEKKIEEEIQNSELPLVPIMMSKTNEDFAKKSGIEESFSGISQESEKEFSVPKFIQILHDLDRAEAKAKEQISTANIIPSSDGNFKRYIFQLSVGPETGIEESDKDNQTSQGVFVHVFFNVSDVDENTSASEINLKSEGSVIDPIYPPMDPEITLPELDSSFHRSSWEQDPLMWWVNRSEFPETRFDGFKSEDEPQSKSSNEASAFENTGYSDKNFFDVLFGHSHSLVDPETEEAEDKNSTEVTQPENLDKFFTDFVSSIISSEDENKHAPSVLIELDESSETVKDTLEEMINKLNADIKEKATKPAVNKTVDQVTDYLNDLDKQHIDNILNQQMNSTEAKHEVGKKEVTSDEKSAATLEKVKKELDDLQKTLNNIEILDEYHDIIGTQTERMIVEPEDELAWKDEEDWFHTQPTWKEDYYGFLNFVFEDVEPQNEEYHDPRTFDSSEYVYED